MSIFRSSLAEGVPYSIHHKGSSLSSKMTGAKLSALTKSRNRPQQLNLGLGGDIKTLPQINGHTIRRDTGNKFMKLYTNSQSTILDNSFYKEIYEKYRADNQNQDKKSEKKKRTKCKINSLKLLMDNPQINENDQQRREKIAVACNDPGDLELVKLALEAQTNKETIKSNHSDGDSSNESENKDVVLPGVYSKNIVDPFLNLLRNEETQKDRDLRKSVFTHMLRKNKSEIERPNQNFSNAIKRESPLKKEKGSNDIFKNLLKTEFQSQPGNIQIRKKSSNSNLNFENPEFIRTQKPPKSKKSSKLNAKMSTPKHGHHANKLSLLTPLNSHLSESAIKVVNSETFVQKPKRRFNFCCF